MWDPGKYLRYADERARPFAELLNRVDADKPRRGVDLGCGPGHLTVRLIERWPDAQVKALDSSPEMVAAARANGIDARVQDVRDWVPPADADVVVCNAVLQWVPGHEELLPRWAEALPPGAWLAVQVPGHQRSPSHQLVREFVADPRWGLDGEAQVRDVLDPMGYAELLEKAGCTVDAWETTYLQRLHGPDAVLEWLTGTTLRPIRAALNDERWADFCAQLGARLREAYPMRPDGTTWFPFRRVFFVARTRQAA
ncbi:trans-aconitate 2-methyltransferase [Thermocrispum agreste]|uniref:trans-aconitate 2-methyltransferase n=1 Tax=Thermocrispum agreste TaxID=37925 RepID=UPI000411CBAB|nr:trans-aconitate 2-methyltransferase [Thermocrispum agreste]